MFTFSKTVPFTSAVVPGVKCVLKTQTVALRAQIEMEAAGYYGKVHQLVLDMPDIKDADQSEKAKAARIALWMSRQRLERSMLAPITLRNLIESVVVNGEPADVADLIANAPAELIDEIYAFVESGMRLSAEEQGELLPPSTSTGQEVGGIEASIVATASA